ncbi:hypothetical protein ACFY36_51015 [Actinoplanes sp. NPDC000266]
MNRTTDDGTNENPTTHGRLHRLATRYITRPSTEVAHTIAIHVVALGTLSIGEHFLSTLEHLASSTLH